MSADITMLDETDAAADDEIRACLNPSKLRSFFLYAGAGSGKTRSLVSALSFVRETYGPALWRQGRRVGVITYTNAAADEIRSRLKHDSLIEVATIHSFLWSLVAGYNHDIREWLRTSLVREIEALEDAQRRGRAGKASEQRARSIINKTERLARLDEVRVFTYSPNGENRGRASLNHAEVISMATSFITAKPALAGLLINRFPILLIDESQDTNKHLIDALFELQSQHEDRFCLGLFGDTMQRIYADGKPKLEQLIPVTWAKPGKKMNHRCPERVVRLINKIREEEDDHLQINRSDKAGGTARLFLAPADAENKASYEQKAGQRMAEITGDTAWNQLHSVKMLALEHLMSARRLGFVTLFQPLYEIKKLRTGLLAGTLPGLRFFSHEVLPVVEAQRRGDSFAVAALLRKRSPLLKAEFLRLQGDEQRGQIKVAREAVADLANLWDSHQGPICIDVLTMVAQSKLFEIPEILKPYVAHDLDADMAAELERIINEAGTAPEADADEEGEALSAIIQAWQDALQAPINEVPLYQSYVEGRSSFDTHQGVKGREFPRVMVVIDDQEAKGFMFSYNKLLKTAPKSKTDLDHEAAGEDTSVNRTRRLFYVTCSRAEEGLALMVYSDNRQGAKAGAISSGWFQEDEIELLA